MGRFSLTPNRIAGFLTVIGVISVTVGVGFVFWPAALVVFGVACVCVGLFGVDVE